MASGYRTLLLSRGEDADHTVVRALVPVGVRTQDSSGVTQNRVSAILYALPVHLADPVERLRAVEAQMGELKRSGMAEAGDLVTTMGDLAPPMIVGAVTRVGIRVMHRLSQRSINTVTTNVPGPQFPLYCLGREISSTGRSSPSPTAYSIGTAILSYNGHLFYGITGDYDTAADVGLLAQAISDGVIELHDLAIASGAEAVPVT